MILKPLSKSKVLREHYYFIAFLVLPSTKDVRRVTFAAFLLPAGRLRPSLSNFSLKQRPPFLDFALSGGQGGRRGGNNNVILSDFNTLPQDAILTWI